MLNALKQRVFFSHRHPRWMVFLVDLFLALLALILAYLVRFNFDIPQIEIDSFPIVFPLVLGIRALSFFIGKTYMGMVRFTSQRDAAKIFVTLLAGSVLFEIINTITYVSMGIFIIPNSIVIIEYLGLTFLMLSLRFIFKTMYVEVSSIGLEKRNVIIFGAGESGIIAKRTLERDRGTRYKVLAFIDDDLSKTGKQLEGVKIHPFEKLDQLLTGNEVAHLIISVQNLSPSRKQEIIEKCIEHKTRVLTVPPASKWINGELSFKQIKKINIEDLLERDPIKLNEKNIRQKNSGKVILVTGAAGSIGSEIARQLLRYNPGKLILLDQAESPLYDLEQELKDSGKEDLLEIVIGDIRNQDRMRKVFSHFRPELVYHAAAYKHVPMMEMNPSESIKTNVVGTRIVADLAHEFGTGTFVFVSTDKAVNPTNVMGASKRIAEIYVQALSKSSKTQFITTRFGNVLGSNGSVIPRFRSQIEKGGPITITHPDITRFFMTIPEACQLVLEAGSMGEGGEIFMFDMGQSVKISELAKKMVRLSGLELGKDIQIVYTGLRPGEKLYEELLADQEKSVPTHHNQIVRAVAEPEKLESISVKIDLLNEKAGAGDNSELVKIMKQAVPEFISNNSEFEALDRQKNT
jgi:FlaA1/EpsC-like NDP-sugar epimerase